MQTRRRGRPCLARRVACRPEIKYFKPRGVLLRQAEIIILSAEEIEAFRLRHLNGLEQTEAAAKMRTSQSTYQRILSAASRKIAEALVNGKAIQIGD